MSIINQIFNKFPSDYAVPRDAAHGGAFSLALANNKQDVFSKRYYADKAFKSKVNSSYAYKKQTVLDFLLVFDELREYLKPELQSAELLLIEENKVSALKISDVSSALEIAENVEEFRLLMLEKHLAKANIWFELERKLSETRI